VEKMYQNGYIFFFVITGDIHQKKKPTLGYVKSTGILPLRLTVTVDMLESIRNESQLYPTVD